MGEKKVKTSFKAAASSYFKGPETRIYDPKLNQKDKNNFVIYIALVLGLVIFFFLRGGVLNPEELTYSGSQGLIDIGNAFTHIFKYGFSGSYENALLSTLFIALPVLFIGGAICLSLFAKKHHYVSLWDAIYTGVLGICLYLLIYELFAFNFVYNPDGSRYLSWFPNGRWLIYIFMSAGYYVFLFGLGVRTYRLFYKALDRKECPERIEDYKGRVLRSRKWLNRLGIYFKKNWAQVLSIILLIALVFSVLLPVIILLYRSVKTPVADLNDPYAVSQTVEFRNYAEAWNTLRSGFLNSFITTICVTVGVTVLASVLAYGFIRFHFPGKKILYFFIIALMMIPAILTLVSRFNLVSNMGMVGNLAGIIIPGIAGYIPTSFMLMFTFFAALPKDLFEAADIDGAGDFSIYLNVVVPLSKPILTTIAIQTFVGEWNDYLWANLIVGQEEQWYTLPILLNKTYTSTFMANNAPYAFAGYALSALPLVLVFIIASKQFIEGLTSGAFKM